MANDILWPFGQANVADAEITDGEVTITQTDNLEIISLDVIEDTEITLVAGTYLKAGAMLLLNITDGSSAGATITFSESVTGSTITATTDDHLLTFIYDGDGFLLTNNQTV